MKKFWSDVILIILISSIGSVLTISTFLNIFKTKNNSLQKPTNQVQVFEPLSQSPPKIIFPTVETTNAVFEGEYQGEILPTNPGYWVDLNSDNTPDFVKFISDTLYWKKSTQGELIPILKMNGNIIGYNIKFINNKNHFYYITSDKKAWIRKNLGNDDKGTPYFGDAEEQ